jgi:small subunit ribosomal protein S11
MRNINVIITGPGGGREAALRVFNNMGFKIGLIKDMTPIPHNGCRPAKRRRV